MPDLINLLPDSIANQIAAGEVVQRPASVVKELLENSIDAGSSRIRLVVYEGGKNGIQVVDNGLGMSPMDARLCFERHATSKITQASDLESIATMGFRGEALASIAAVAEVTLITRRAQDELGVKITLSASSVTENTPTACPVGANFFVRNLFFNVPARRRFLKSTPIELKHVVAEFLRVALPNPTVAMSLYHQQATLYSLSSGTRKQRILDLFGKELSDALIPIDLASATVAIEGFVVDPLAAKKRYNEQYLFVNGRYMRSAYFNRAIFNAFERLLPPDVLPSFFLYFTVDPHRIDVNIHPTKTEIKFEDEHVIWEILFNAVRTALGRSAGLSNVATTQEQAQHIPSLTSYSHVGKKSAFPLIPAVQNGQTTAPCNRNVMQTTEQTVSYSTGVAQSGTRVVQEVIQRTPLTSIFTVGGVQEEASSQTLNLDNSYVVTTVGNSLRIIDQHRAHARILYERMQREEQLQFQNLMYPAQLSLIPSQRVGIETFVEQVQKMGLSIELTSERNLQLNSIMRTNMPLEAEEFLQTLYQEYIEKETTSFEHILDRTRAALALAMAYKYATPLSPELRATLVADLFACSEPMLDPKRRATMYVLDTTQLQSSMRAKS